MSGTPLGRVYVSIEGDARPLGIALDQSERLLQGFAGRGQNILKTGLAIGLGTTTFRAGIEAASQAFRAGEAAIIDYNSKIDSTTAVFAKLEGSSAKAQKRVQDLFQFAKETPFDFSDVLQGASALETLGGAVLATRERLTLYGDAAAATVNITGSLAEGFKETTFWTARFYEALQAGDPGGRAALRLEQLGLLTTQQRKTIELAAQAGASADELFAIYERGLQRFAGLQAIQQKNFQTQISTAKDSLTQLAGNAGRPLFDAFVQGLQVLNQALEKDGTRQFAKDVAADVEGMVHRIQTALADPRNRDFVEHLFADFTSFGKGFLAFVNDLGDTIGPILGELRDLATALDKLTGGRAGEIAALTLALLGMRRQLAVGAAFLTGEQSLFPSGQNRLPDGRLMTGGEVRRAREYDLTDRTNAAQVAADRAAARVAAAEDARDRAQRRVDAVREAQENRAIRAQELEDRKAAATAERDLQEQARVAGAQARQEFLQQQADQRKYAADVLAARRDETSALRAVQRATKDAAKAEAERIALATKAAEIDAQVALRAGQSRQARTVAMQAERRTESVYDQIGAAGGVVEVENRAAIERLAQQRVADATRARQKAELESQIAQANVGVGGRDAQGRFVAAPGKQAAIQAAKDLAVAQKAEERAIADATAIGTTHIKMLEEQAAAEKALVEAWKQADAAELRRIEITKAANKVAQEAVLAADAQAAANKRLVVAKDEADFATLVRKDVQAQGVIPGSGVVRQTATGAASGAQQAVLAAGASGAPVVAAVAQSATQATTAVGPLTAAIQRNQQATAQSGATAIRAAQDYKALADAEATLAAKSAALATEQTLASTAMANLSKVGAAAGTALTVVSQVAVVAGVAFAGLNAVMEVAFHQSLPQLIISTIKYGDALEGLRRQIRKNVADENSGDPEHILQQMRDAQAKIDAARGSIKEFQAPTPAVGPGAPLINSVQAGRYAIINAMNSKENLDANATIREQTILLEALQKQYDVARRALGEYSDEEYLFYKREQELRQQGKGEFIGPVPNLPARPSVDQKQKDDAATAAEQQAQQLFLTVPAVLQQTILRNAQDYQRVGRAVLQATFGNFSPDDFKVFNDLSNTYRDAFRAQAGTDTLNDVQNASLQSQDELFVRMASDIKQYGQVLDTTAQDARSALGGQADQVLALADAWGKLARMTEAATNWKKVVDSIQEAIRVKEHDRDVELHSIQQQIDDQDKVKTAHDRANAAIMLGIEKRRDVAQDALQKEQRADAKADAAAQKVINAKQEQLRKEQRADQEADEVFQKRIDAQQKVVSDLQRNVQARAGALQAVLSGQTELYRAQIGEVDDLTKRIIDRYEAELGGLRRVRDATAEAANAAERGQRSQLLGFSEAIATARDAGNAAEVARLTRLRQQFQGRSSQSIDLQRQRAQVAQDQLDTRADQLRKEGEIQGVNDAKALKTQQDILDLIQKQRKEAQDAAKERQQALQDELDALEQQHKEQQEAAKERQQALQDNLDAIDDERTAQERLARDQQIADQKVLDDLHDQYTAADNRWKGEIDNLNTRLINAQNILNYYTLQQTAAQSTVDALNAQNTALDKQFLAWQKIITLLQNAGLLPKTLTPGTVSVPQDDPNAPPQTAPVAPPKPAPTTPVPSSPLTGPQPNSLRIGGIPSSPFAAQQVQASAVQFVDMPTIHNNAPLVGTAIIREEADIAKLGQAIADGQHAALLRVARTMGVRPASQLKA